MLDEKTFFEYFYKLDDDLFHQRNILIKRLKHNPLDFAAYDLLREINARTEQSRKIYMDLKPFFDINRKLLSGFNLDK